MDPEFQPYVDQLEAKFQAMVTTKPVKVDSLPARMPKAGVYVFYEKGTALYVGRSNRMKDRIKYHSRKGAKDAPFAFRLAREATGYIEATYQKKGSRADLLTKPEFRIAFSEAKTRIREMDIRFVEEPNQIKQALLEIYAAVVLEARHNDFGTH